MVATTTVTAGALFKVFGGGDMPEFQGLVDLFVNGLLGVMQMFLGIQEITGHRIGQQGVAVFFEFSDFLAFQRLGILLFLLQRLAFGHQLFILGLGFVVRQEGVNALPGGAQTGLVQERLAQFTGFLSDNGFSNFSGHSVLSNVRASCPNEARP